MMKYYTHLLVEYPSSFEIKFNQEEFKKVDIKISQFNDTLRFFSIKTNELDDVGFESIRNKFILLLNNMNLYISILYDSISVERHGKISNSIYILEREFRNLIEIVFQDNLENGEPLSKVAVYRNIEKRGDKKKNRGPILDAIQNPLDELDFIQLKKFVTENMALDSNGTLINKLDVLFEKFETKAQTGFDNQDKIEEIYNDIKEMKKSILTRKENQLSASKLYNHLTVAVSDQWKSLYDIRNIWAHNNCIITKNEFDEYNNLSTRVLNKIDVEFTLLTFFKDKEESNIVLFEYENRIRLSVKKQEFHGRENCKLEMIVLEDGKSAVLEHENFTYKEFDKWFEVLEIEELTIYNKNPLLLYNCEDTKEYFYDRLKRIKITDVEKIAYEFMLDSGVTLSKPEGDAYSISKEIEEHLRIIFN